MNRVERMKSLILEALDYEPRKNVGLKKRPDVIYRGGRAYCRRVLVDGVTYVQKVFCRSAEARMSLDKELAAFKRFHQYPWITEIVDVGKTWIGQPWYLTREYPEYCRLDFFGPIQVEFDRYELALEILLILLDLHYKRVAHRDFHSRHLYVIDGRPRLIDFDASLDYPDSYSPSFADAYDITGRGLESPFATDHVGYFSPHRFSVGEVLGVQQDRILRELVDRVDRRVDAQYLRARSIGQPMEGVLAPGEGAGASIDRNADRTTPSGIEIFSRVRSDSRVLVVGLIPSDVLRALLTEFSGTVDVVLTDWTSRLELQRWVSVNDAAWRVHLLEAMRPGDERAPYSCCVLGVLQDSTARLSKWQVESHVAGPILILPEDEAMTGDSVGTLTQTRAI